MGLGGPWMGWLCPTDHEEQALVGLDKYSRGGSGESRCGRNPRCFYRRAPSIYALIEFFITKFVNDRRSGSSFTRGYRHGNGSGR